MAKAEAMLLLAKLNNNKKSQYCQYDNLVDGKIDWFIKKVGIARSK